MEDLFGNLRRMTLKESLELKMEAENGEWVENELLELMCRYQRYHDIVEEQAYVIRGSVLSCEYGTKEVRIDCVEDHGVYVGTAPLMTCGDCQHTNIHEFGSCMCPESNYVGRLPMTPGFFMDGSMAEKALGNNQAHICRPLINLEQGWRQIDEDLLVESHAHMTEPVLLSSAVLVCNYGGIIRVREVPEKVETPGNDEVLRWIPTEIMQIKDEAIGAISEDPEDNLTFRINQINEDKSESDPLRWNQEKIDLLWEKCREYYDDYGVQVDPRLMLAIIAQEGTGSFNTDSGNPAPDGGNGPDTDYVNDLKKAVELLGGKIIAYVQFHTAFSRARSEAFERGLAGIKWYDDILHYLNWETPCLYLNSLKLKSGVYAQHNGWNSGVRQIYNELAYNDVEKEYTDYVLGLDANLFMRIAEQKGIAVRTDIEFHAEQNGQDKNGDDNNEYTIVGRV